MSDRKAKIFTITMNGNGVVQPDEKGNFNVKVRALSKNQARAHLANRILAVEVTSMDELLTAGRENQTIHDATVEAE